MLPKSVRGRAVMGTAVAMVLFGLVIGAASYVLVTKQAVSAQQELLQSRVTDVLEQANESLPSSDLDLASSQLPNTVLIQVVDTTGHVFASSAGVAPNSRVCPDPLPPNQQIGSAIVDVGHGPEKVIRETSYAQGANAVVCAVLSEEPVQRAQIAVVIALAIVLPLVVAGVCIAVWLAVGRALRSVDDLRSQAERLADTDDRLLRVHKTGDEVELLGTTLNHLLETLHHKSRSTRQFIADAGHELRTPLATLRIALEFGEDSDEGELRASVHDALADLDRLERLIQDLLVLARSDAMETTHHFETLSLDSVVRDSVEAYQRTPLSTDLDLVLEPVEMEGDGVALRSMVTNLLTNAMRHAHSRVTVSLRTVAGRAELSVEDDGEGLSDGDVVRIFDRFVRLGDARERDSGGSGLGLSIVASVASVHGGTVSAIPGPGGHFVVVLPCISA